MSSINLKRAAIFVLLALIFFAGYAFAESLGFVYDAHEHSSKTCETVISSLGRAIVSCGKTSSTLHQTRTANIAPSPVNVLAGAGNGLASSRQAGFTVLPRAFPANLRL
ncbi:MAG: hypothetical protein M0Z75_14310 [Nitrospiraceae bacterium]|nr:hypothetical protein [Nitrospiraceae bacterium]